MASDSNLIAFYPSTIQSNNEDPSSLILPSTHSNFYSLQQTQLRSREDLLFCIDNLLGLNPNSEISEKYFEFFNRFNETLKTKFNDLEKIMGIFKEFKIMSEEPEFLNSPFYANNVLNGNFKYKFMNYGQLLASKAFDNLFYLPYFQNELGVEISNFLDTNFDLKNIFYFNKCLMNSKFENSPQTLIDRINANIGLDLNESTSPYCLVNFDLVNQKNIEDNINWGLTFYGANRINSNSFDIYNSKSDFLNAIQTKMNLEIHSNNYFVGISVFCLFKHKQDLNGAPIYDGIMMAA